VKRITVCAKDVPGRIVLRGEEARKLHPPPSPEALEHLRRLEMMVPTRAQLRRIRMD
jgi:hypothetical protein